MKILKIIKYITSFFKKDIKKQENREIDKKEVKFNKNILKQNNLYRNNNCDDSIFFYGSENGKVRRKLDKKTFLSKINKLFPDGFETSERNYLYNSYIKSSMSKNSYEEFLKYFSELTTKQMILYLYTKKALESDIVFAATPYNKNPIKPKWYKINQTNILLFKESMHMLYLKDYINSLNNSKL